MSPAPSVAVGTGDGRWVWEKLPLSWVGIFPLVFFSSKYPDVTALSGWVCEWSNNSVPFGDQTFLRRRWIQATGEDYYARFWPQVQPLLGPLSFLEASKIKWKKQSICLFTFFYLMDTLENVALFSRGTLFVTRLNMGNHKLWSYFCSKTWTSGCWSIYSK